MRIALFLLPYAGAIALIWNAHGFWDALACTMILATIITAVLGMWWLSGLAIK